MARDYSNRSNSNRKKKQAQQGKSASSNKRRKPKGNARKKASGAPGWVWLASGLCIGLVVAVVVYLVTRPTSHPGRGQETIRLQLPDAKASKDQTSSDKTEIAPAEQEKTRSGKQGNDDQLNELVFYDRFHNAKIVFPTERYTSVNQSDTGGEHDNTGENTAQQSGQSRTQTQQQSPQRQWQAGTYVIQTGSFVTAQNAHQLKAKLTLLGMDARILKYQLQTGQVVYRVRTQTITSSDRLNELLGRLQDEGIGTLVLRKNN